MPKACLYFQVHQPYRLKSYSIFNDYNGDTEYFDEEQNKQIIRKVASKCYLPANKLLLALIRQHQGQLKVAFSISGTAIEQFKKYCPEVIASFRALVLTGCVEILGETYYHSLASIFDEQEFRAQVQMHRNLISSLFDYYPTTFRNTELIYNDSLAPVISDMGFDTLLTEGVPQFLDWRSENYLYKAAGSPTLSLLLRNNKLSDDIAYRFSNRTWVDYPLTADKYTNWVLASEGEVANLFMDYETFGEHHWKDSGIFDFMVDLPKAFLNSGIEFMLPSEANTLLGGRENIENIIYHEYVSWADTDKDLSAWLGNEIQQDAANHLYAKLKDAKKINDQPLLECWRRLSTADHFYYMSNKTFDDGSVHSYFSPYQSPYNAFINYMNVIKNYSGRLAGLLNKSKQEPLSPVAIGQKVGKKSVELSTKKVMSHS